MTTSLVLEFEFSSAHFYHQPQWSEEKNREVFGRCFTEYGHGHNYLLQVEVAAKTSEVTNLRKKILSVVNKLDHEHLNFVVPYFKDKIPTSEVILQYFEMEISKVISENLLSLKIFETADMGSQL